MGVSIAVVGPGAIGSTVAACLHRAGNRPLLCGRTARDHLDVRPDPSVLDGEHIVVPIRVRTDPREVTQPVELVLFAVKATQIGEASAWLGALCDHNTTVCVLQNGVEQIELVQPHCPVSTVVPAVGGVPPKRNPADGCGFADSPNSRCLPQTARSRPILADAGWKVTVTDDFVTAAWHKLLTNAVSGLMVLTMRRSGMFRRDDILRLSRLYLEECLAVARAEGANSMMT